MAPSLAIVCTLIAFAAPLQMDAAAPSVRFHHFHFQVGEPVAALNFGMTAVNGSRVLLPGLGVGVRVGVEYALFDRIDASEIGPAVRPSAEAAYTAARAWLRAHGVEVSADAGGIRARLSAPFGGEVLDHVAFAAADIAVVIGILRARGAQPFRVTEASTFFRIPDATVVEIVRDLDAPDALWCPMHPDVRSAGPGKCPICGMDLVPIPPLRLGEYRMDVTVTPGAHGVGASTLRMTLRDPETSQPVTAFATIHERLLHLFIIDRRLEYFRHVHPEPAGEGVFELKQEVPPGEYVLIADFLPQNGRTQMLQRAIVTPGYRGVLFPPAPHLVPDSPAEHTAGGVRVRLVATELRAGKEAVLRFTLIDTATGAPVSDLEPLLGAAGHMLIVNADLTEANHVHPEEPATRGPSMTFQPLMPAAGLYKLWLQFQRHGVVITIPFVLSVQEP